MTRPMWTHWACTCGARGEYPWADAPKTDAASQDGKHQKTCAGSVTTSTRVELVARIATMVGRLA